MQPAAMGESISFYLIAYYAPYAFELDIFIDSAFIGLTGNDLMNFDYCRDLNKRDSNSKFNKSFIQAKWNVLETSRYENALNLIVINITNKFNRYSQILYY